MRKVYSFSRCLGTMVVFMPLVLRAETVPSEAIELPRFEVVGSRLATTDDGMAAMDAPAGSLDLVADRYAGVPDFLQNQAGVFYNPDPGGAGVSELYVRGGETNFTQVLLDGVPVNNVMDDRGGTFDLGLLSAALDSGVTLQRGGGSARLGSGALSGVLAIESLPEGAERGLLARVAMAPDANRRTDLRLRQEMGAWLLQGAGSWGHSEWAEAGRGESEFWQAGAAGNGEIADDLTVRFSVRRMHRESAAFPADSGGWRHAVMRELERRESEHRLASLRVDKAWSSGRSVRARVYAYDNDQEIDSPGVAPGARDPMGLPATTASTTLRRWGVAVDTVQPVSDFWDLAAGVEIAREEGETASVFDYGFATFPADYAIARTLRSVGVESRWRVGDWRLTYAGRLDENERDGSRGSHAARLDWSPRGEPTLRLGVSAQNAFKFPSLYALSNALVGNPDLVSEKATTVAAHLVWQPAGGPWALEATVFQTEYTDLIDFHPGPPPRLVNRGSFEVRGLDLSSTLRLGAVRWRAFLSLAQPDLPNGASPLLGRPEWWAGSSLLWQASENFTLEARVRALGERLGSSIPTGEQALDAYVLGDLVADWKSGETWTLRLRLENLWDTDFETSVGNPGRGFTPWISWLAEF